MKFSLIFKYNTLLIVSLMTGPLVAQNQATPLGQQVTPTDAVFEAPAIVTTKFNSEFPNTSATWKKAGEFYAAELVNAQTQTKRLVVYDSFGNRQYTRSELVTEDIPKPVKSYIRANFPDDKVTVWTHEFPDKKLYYFAPVKKDTLRFDSTGKYMAQKR